MTKRKTNKIDISQLLEKGDVNKLSFWCDDFMPENFTQTKVILETLSFILVM